MDDYRGKAEESPVVWCIKCQRLFPSENMTIMKTVYRVTPTGVYPYGMCINEATVSNSRLRVTQQQS